VISEGDSPPEEGKRNGSSSFLKKRTKKLLTVAYVRNELTHHREAQ
jgi:hypothetical protein